MKKTILFLILLAISIWLGIKIHQDPGYILIGYQHWRITTTLWFGLLSLFVAVLILNLLYFGIRKIFHWPQQLRFYLTRKRQKNAQQLTQEGFSQLISGQWEDAEKTLKQGVANNNAPVLNYLGAAIAAQQQNEIEQRDHYLMTAYQTDPQSELTIGLTRAQLAIKAGQWELALATLQHLQQLHPRHSTVLNLLQEVYTHLHDWENLLSLLPELKKQKILNSSAYSELEQQIYSAILKLRLQQLDLNAMQQWWDDLPNHLSRNPRLVELYVPYLVTHHEITQAEKLIRQTLKYNWDGSLALQYCEMTGGNTEKQVEQANDWLKHHPQDASLLLGLGKLNMRLTLWNKARDYLERSLAIAPHAKTYLLLGQLHEALNENQAATQAYRQGLMAEADRGLVH